MSRSSPPWLGYVLPFAVYLILTTLEAQFPRHYTLLYITKVVLVTALVIRVSPRVQATGSLSPAVVLLSIAFGVLLTWAWVAIDRITPHPQWLTSIVGTRHGFNPFTAIDDPTIRAVFIAVRFFGLVLIVPIIEELFYRDFLLRFIANPDDFRRVAVGAMTLVALAVNIILFASSHPEWLSAIVFAAAMCLLVWKTKDIRVCILAHAATNLALGIYVIVRGAWQYW